MSLLKNSLGCLTGSPGGSSSRSSKKGGGDSPGGGRRSSKKGGEDSISGWEDDKNIWTRELEDHFYGEFSFAVVKSNDPTEDCSHVESRENITFVGVYDGHGGPDAAKHVCDNLFNNLLKVARQYETMAEHVIHTAFAETEKDFLDFVRKVFKTYPEVARIGSCVLVGVIWKGILFLANLGDSRAVIGRVDVESNKMVADQLTKDHNAKVVEIRDELKRLHPEDSEIVIDKDGCWRVKGKIQVSRAIGDAYLKKPEEFYLGREFPNLHLIGPIRGQVLRSDPEILRRHIQPNDQFIIFASDGLWDYVSNEEAVEIVRENAREGVARRLVVTAIKRGARNSKISYDGVKKLRKDRRDVHDDISVIVVFIDKERSDVPRISRQGFVGPSSADESSSSTFESPKISDEDFP